MKILFCSPWRLDDKLGAPKVLLELAAELEDLGCACTVIGPEHLGADPADYPEKLHRYLQAHAAAYDVVDFEYKGLSYTRDEFPETVLMVARSQLLQHHFLDIRLPPAPTLRSRIRTRLWRPVDRRRLRAKVRRDDVALREADLVLVLNRQDEAVLRQHGLAPAKIHVFPNGMSEARHAAFEAVSVDPPERPLVAFIGMYGPRKGANEFPALVRAITRTIPEARFRLLGTRGMFQTAAEVHRCFPRALRRYLEVIPVYEPDALPALLAPCAVGIFPSYLEGFPLGVMEMLAAAVPVIAFEAPGAPEMLPPDYLVARGDARAMAERAGALLQDRERLAAARRWARQRVQPLRWRPIALSLKKTYEEALARKRAGDKQATTT
jgi:glycosyltransferase involved in cell wall biosynthesis